MKLPFWRTIILLALLFVGFLLIESAAARSVPEYMPNETKNSSVVERKINATDWAKVRREQGQPIEEMAPDSKLPQYPHFSSIKHLARTNKTSLNDTNATSTEPAIPFGFDISHLPCDLDSGGRESVVWAFPTYCVWAWNNKYNDEKSYRVFKIFQLEGFFFGQYYERLKRFEMDPKVWDYMKTGVS
ncbi:uncharacterized protein LOC108160646 [Drosophila miranda]|uniref:uncharacterized protein LOC108160646 n=1 Tax=Drosophila miranda TaxID=7229 RepID=UPI0007E81757|nr:uncharacterized protein LOC108160646 [Drosophila miranda]